MKINKKIISSLCVALIAILVVGKAKLFSYHPHQGFGVDSYEVNPNRLDTINNELTAMQQKTDSIKSVKKVYTDGFDGFSGTTNGFFGLITPDDAHFNNGDQEYLLLMDIGLKINENKGHSYLTYSGVSGNGTLLRTKLVKNSDGELMVYTKQKVNYGYDSGTNGIFLPINSGFWKFCWIALTYIIMLLLLATILFVLFTFFNFLSAISKNRAFEEGNIQRLRDLSIALLILGSYHYIINLIIYLVFSINHPTEGVTITYSFWDHDYFIIIMATVTYLIYTAFSRGMALQEENDLTI